MYIPPYITKIIVASAVPKLIEAVSKQIDNLFSYVLPSNDPIVTKSISKRKKPDTTKLTQKHYDAIIHIYNEWVIYNRSHPKNKKTQQDLTDVINHELSLDKSRTTLSKIWRGVIKREDLPTG